MITPFRTFLCTHRNCPTFPAVPLSPRAILYTPTWPTYCIDSNLGICTFLISLQLPVWRCTFNFLFDPSGNLYFTLFYNNFIRGTRKNYKSIYLETFWLYLSGGIFFHQYIVSISLFLCFIFNFLFIHTIFLISF